MTQGINAVQELNTIIDNLSTRLGMASDHIYPLLVRQSYVTGFTAVFWCIIYICVMVWIFLYRKRAHYKKDLDGNTAWDRAKLSNDEGLYITLVFILTITFIGFLVALITSFNTAVNSLANPEWYAIRELLSSIRR